MTSRVHILYGERIRIFPYLYTTSAYLFRPKLASVLSSIFVVVTTRASTAVSSRSSSSSLLLQWTPTPLEVNSPLFHDPSSNQKPIPSDLTMPIISDPSLIFYSCISKGTTILAELNGDQSRDLSSLAQKCIDLAPPHHAVFSHTIRRRRFTFLIDDPFVYFAVFHDTLAKSEGLGFLNGVKLRFCDLIKAGSVTNFDHFSLQTQFDFLLHGLLSDSESVTLPRMVLSADSRNPSLDSTNGVVSTPLLTKKKRSSADSGDGNLENKEGSCPDYPKNNSPFFNDPQKAKQVWKKHVWVVLSLDVFICLVLFGIWLRVCGGFRCVDR